MAMNKSFRGMMLTNKEFFTQACRWKNCNTVQTAAEWWSAFQEVIIREIFYNGVCRVPGLGTFTIEEIPETYQRQKAEGGRFVTYRVPARIKPIFTPEDDFINDINMSGVTKAYRKRLKDNALTQRDTDREIRASEIGEVVDDMVAERKEWASEQLQELLKKKRDAKKDELSKRSQDSDTES